MRRWIGLGVCACAAGLAIGVLLIEGVLMDVAITDLDIRTSTTVYEGNGRRVDRTHITDVTAVGLLRLSDGTSLGLASPLTADERRSFDLLLERIMVRVADDMRTQLTIDAARDYDPPRE